MTKLTGFLLTICSLVLVSSCSKDPVKLEEENLEDYFNLAPGKFTIYQLDSLVKVPFNDTAFTTVSYQAKDLVDTIITDGLGQKSWRIFRYLRPVNSTDESDWRSDITYFITPNRNDVQVVENNLRYQKLVLPITLDKVWRGNSHIATTPGSPLDYLDAWEYSYQDINEPFMPWDIQVDSTVTVLQADIAESAYEYSPVDIDQDGYRTHSYEVYAKNVGLIYKYLVHWKYEARTLNANGTPVPPYPNGNKLGFGITMRMLSHN